MLNKRKKINSILSRFDFRTVKDVMLKNNITWKKDGVEYIPSEGELRIKAKEMMESATSSNTNYCKVSGNGFVCKKTSTSLELFYCIDHCWA